MFSRVIYSSKDIVGQTKDLSNQRQAKNICISLLYVIFDIHAK